MVSTRDASHRYRGMNTLTRNKPCFLPGHSHNIRYCETALGIITPKTVIPIDPTPPAPLASEGAVGSDGLSEGNPALPM